MPKAKKKNSNLIVAVLVAAVFIAVAIVFLGIQIGKGSSGDISAQIEQGIKDYVAAQKAGNAQAAPTEPVKVSVDDDPVKGNPDAPVTIVEFSDYECPFCGRFFSQTLPEITKNYIDTGKAKLVYRDFPLGFHPSAKPAAIAAECVREQGDDDTYFAYHDKIFSNQGALSITSLKSWAGELGLNQGDFDECLDSEKYADEVQKDFIDGQKAGVRGTPAFFINGRIISGAQPYAVFDTIIKEELNK